MMRRITKFLLGSVLVLAPLLSYGQVTIAQDDFDAARTLGFGTTTTISGSSAASNALPASSPFAISGNAATAVNATTTLTSTAINTASYTNISLSFRAAAFSINSTGNGMDATDNIIVSIDPGTGTFAPVGTLNGNSNAVWGYATGAATLTATYPTAVTAAPAAGGNRTTDGYSTIVVNALPANAAMRIRIVLKNDNANERWVIDNVLLTGTAASSPTKLAVTSIAPSSPTVNNLFDVTVQSQDAGGNATPVAANTTVNLTVATGTGTLSGTATGTINANASSVTITGLAYNVAEAGVSLTATDAAATTPLTAGTSATFTVAAPASQLALVNVPATGSANNNLNTFTVEARRPDNTVDAGFTGNITIAKASGPGILSGTLTVAAVNGVATFTDAQFSATGTYTIIASAGSLTTATSGNIVISVSSTAADYFRSRTTGVWTDASTWESSPDGVTYITSTLVPSETANTISIEAGHTITISTASVSADQVVIRNGATLSFNPATSQTFTLNDGAGIDLEIENGGTLAYPQSSKIITLASATPTIDVATGGRITIIASPQNIAASNSNYIYNTGSILEYTGTGNFSASGTTYFPNANASTIPVFRVNNALSGTIGGSSNLTINGVLEANGALTFGLNSTKTFRNGIRGTGAITVTGTSPITISGTTAELGGGALTLNGSSPLNITAGTVVTLSSGKTINAGAINLNGVIMTGTNTLTLGSGSSLTSGSATAYIDGSLSRSSTATTAIVYPMGHNGRFTPVTLTPTTNSATTYVVTNITGYGSTQNKTSLTAPLSSVDASTSFDIARTGTADADITLPFDGLTNATNTANLVVAHYNGTTWESLTSTVGGNSVTTTGVSSFSPFAIGAINGAQPLPLKITAFNIRKESNKTILNWTLQTTDGDERATIERSVDGKTFTELNTQTVEKSMAVKQSYTDAVPAQGINYYRLALTGANGIVTYSNILTAVFSKESTVSIYPNPAQQFVQLDWANSETPVSIEVRNVTGNLISKQIVKGASHYELPVAGMANGAYIITFQQGETVKHQQIQVVH